MNEQPTEKAKAKVDEWLDERVKEFGQHWLRYAALMVTGTLTGYAAWSLTQQWLYVVAIVLLAEGSALFWTSRVEDYGNKVQVITSVIGTVIAWTAIALTDLASATLIAKLANVEIFTEFAEVPYWAQRTVVFVVPTLAVIHGLLATLHYYFSETAAARREIAKAHREARKQVAQSRAEAEVAIARSEANEYKRLADEHAPRIGESRGGQLWAEDAEKLTPKGQVAETPKRTAEATAETPVISGNGTGPKNR